MVANSKRQASQVDGDIVRSREETFGRYLEYRLDGSASSDQLLNGGYGALANKTFLYFLIENAESVTTTGQVVNRWTSFRINELINTLLENESPKDYIVYGDTDSTFVKLHDIVKLMGIENESKVEITQQLDTFIKEILDPEIQKYTNELADYLNNPQNKMVWEREVIASACILVRKKRYAMSVLDSEGVHYYNNPKLKITGLEAKRSDTPSWAQNPLIECYKLALNKDKKGVHEVVKKLKSTLRKMNVSDVAIPSGVNGVEKYSTPDDTYIKGTPMHIRAAINHNRYLKSLGITHIDRIGSGNNIKYLPLKTPNPLGDNVIGFVSYLPNEFALEKYIDYNTIFYKGFEKPLENFLKAIGWGTEEVIELF